MRRVLVTGSREWGEAHHVYSALAKQVIEYGEITVVHGDCPTGADLHARKWAQDRIKLGMQQGFAIVRHEAYPALWDDFDKAAGPIRNKYMVQLGADVCLAFPTSTSRGTISCMKLAQAAGIEVLNLGTIPEGVNWP